MRKSIVRVFGTLLAIGLFSPVGLLFSMGTQQPLNLTSSAANWADTEQASQLFNQVQHLSRKVEHEVGIIQGEGTDLFWQGQADNMDQVRNHVNEMSSDLAQLARMRSKLEPWQQQLLDRMTPDIHEMVYQTRAAIHVLNGQHNRLALFASNYPQYITVISNKSSQLSSSIGTFTQSVQAAQKMATLEQQTGAKAG